METVLEALFGPLAALECRRSLGRGWVLLVRALATLPPALLLFTVLWFWWFEKQFMPGYSPRGVLVWGTVILEAMFVTTAVVLGPALLAGTMAGEKLRSTLGLLLAAAVSAPEIVMGRLLGRICIALVLVAAGLPSLVWVAALAGLSLAGVATLAALPLAVAFGGGGLTMAVSVAARRGRDALLVAYLFEFLFLLAPVFVANFVSGTGSSWFEAINPYHGIWPLAESQEFQPALTTIALWTSLGVAGCIWAACRLRPNFLREMGEYRRRSRLFSPYRLSTMGDRPMIWKELYVEHVQAFSRVVKWIGVLVLIAYAGTSLFLAGVVFGASWNETETDWADWALAELTAWLGWSWLMVWLMQWALGLRAAAAIASERQRGTWDGLLVSPLTGREIVFAKIYGSLYALRGFFAMVFLAWTTGLLCGALTIGAFTELLAQTLVIGAFMVVFGIGFSLSCQSATRAMTLTIICWLAAGFGMAVLAGILTGMVVFIWFFWTLAQNGAPAGFGASPWLFTVYTAIRLTLYAVAALIAALYLQRRFDALAGRSTASWVQKLQAAARKHWQHAAG